MNTLTHRQFIRRMLDLNGRATFCTVLAFTPPRMRVTNNPYREARKLSLVNGVVNWSYAAAVNRQREREGQPVIQPGEFIEQFYAKPRAWGERVPGSPFVRHFKNGQKKLYLELKVQKSLGYQYLMPDGSEIASADIEPFLVPTSPSKTQLVQNEVLCRDYTLDNIQSITFGGAEYGLVPGREKVEKVVLV